MHAYLIIGTDQKNIIDSAQKIAAEKKSKLVSYDIKKISEVRELQKLVKLSNSENITFVIKNFDEATPQAMSAFLKLLEEPVDGTTYILTSRNSGKILPTILSRVQSIKTTNSKTENKNSAADFINKTLSEKLQIIDSIKKREDALEFIDSFIDSAHINIVSEDYNEILNLSNTLRHALETYSSLKRNGNINLHLSKFVLLIDRR